MVEVVEAEVEQRVLEVVLKALHEVLLLLAVIRNLSRGVASKLQESITIFRDRHSPQLQCKELLLLHLHNARGDVVAAEPLPELVPVESLAVLNWVGLPPVQSCPSQLSCCVQDSLSIIALGDVQLALHCTEPVVSLKRVGRVRERRRVTPQELSTPVAGLRRWRRRRMSVSLLKCLNSVVQGSHHLHLELEVLLRGQRRRHRDPSTLVVLPLVVLPLLVRTTPGIHHLIFGQKIS